MEKSIYIGEFPPPFGGVSTKNEFLCKHIYDLMDCKIVNLYDYQYNPFKMIELAKLIWQAKKKNIYLGIGSQTRLKCLLKIFKCVGGKRMLENTSIYVMGCTLEEYCRKDIEFKELICGVKRLYVELQTMINGLNDIGILNTFLVPNCRDGAMAQDPHQIDGERKIKLLFFSTVNREKGVPFLLEMADILEHMHIKFELDIYGELSDDYKDEFDLEIKTKKNCYYKGVFDTSRENLYKKMSEYDILVLPTLWKGESCIGVLIESKMAGIPAVVSDHKYNSEIILNNIDGIVVSCTNLSHGFADAIKRISLNPKLYDQLAKGAFNSRTKYDIRTYKQCLLKHDQM